MVRLIFCSACTKLIPGIVHVLAALQLAKEFLHMGLATPARAVHDELSAMMSSNSAAVGLKEELRIQMLLGYAEMMAVSDVEQGCVSTSSRRGMVGADAPTQD
jgi:hypothetical protein